MFGPTLPVSGLYLRHVKNMTFGSGYYWGIMMKRGGPKTRQQQKQPRPGDPKSSVPRHNGDRRRGGPSKSTRYGPKSCPMCGDVVADLAQHIRTKHDDAASHPRL
jgi:hypothetical protein